MLIFVGCSTFETRVKKAQEEIEQSLKDLNYTPRDVVLFKTERRLRKGRIWNERQMRMRDRGERTWPELHQFFAHDANYPFAYVLTVGESESDLEKIRWFEFKLDQVFTVYRLEFVKPQYRQEYLQR
jgi:hypothetical protein